MNEEVANTGDKDHATVVVHDFFDRPRLEFVSGVKSPDELGEKWHICRDFINPLADALSKWNSNYDAAIEHVRALLWFDRPSEEKRLLRDPFVTGLERAKTFVRLNTPPDFCTWFEESLRAISDGAREAIKKYDEPHDEGEDARWRDVLIGDFQDRVVEPCVDALRNMSAELERRWPTAPNPAKPLGELTLPVKPRAF